MRLNLGLVGMRLRLRLGVYSLGIYSPGPPIVDLEMHFLGSLHSGVLQSGGLILERPNLDPGTHLLGNGFLGVVKTMVKTLGC